MGILQMLEGMASGTDAQTQQVSGGMAKALDEHPGGLAGLLDQLRNNGMEQHVNSWASGQQQQASPDQIEQGLGNSGFLEKVAQHAGVSPGIAKAALAVLLPMAVSHLSRSGKI